MSEIEMWLFEHALNRAAGHGSRPIVSALWLWGCGDVVRSLPPVEGWAAGDEPFFKAFAAGPMPRMPRIRAANWRPDRALR